MGRSAILSGRFGEAVVIHLAAMSETLLSGGSRHQIGRFRRIRPFAS
ncbi:hypothetical protein EDF58_10852 [Novosphingobium sp. PhB57]|jgi:hypothetical protein|nr:hypothetical protein EDF58_10852 [Novosphingobium sp. PhB57]